MIGSACKSIKNVYVGRRGALLVVENVRTVRELIVEGVLTVKI